MYRIAIHELKSHVGELVQVECGRCERVGTLKGRGARILSIGPGRVESTWLLQTRSGDVEFHPGDCEIYSLQYVPVGVAS